MDFCHLYCIWVAEKIRRMQHIHVEYMTFDPLTAVNKPAQGTKLAINFYFKCVFHCMYCTHLIGDRADTADAGCYIGGFVEITSTQECLKETRRFEYLEFDIYHRVVLYFYIKRTLAFNTGKIINFDCSTFHTEWQSLFSHLGTFNIEVQHLGKRLRKGF